MNSSPTRPAHTPKGIPFVRQIEFEYGVVDQVSPLIRRVIARNPSPFTFHGTGTYIVGQGQVAVIDPGPLLDDHVTALLAALTGETVTHILITHTHMDHSPAAAPLKAATGAPTYGFGPHHDQGGAGADLDFRPDHVLGDGDVITGPGWTIEAVHTPGHTSNHLCFALHEEAALFSGDHVMGWNTSVISPPDGNMQAYVQSLHRLLARDDAIYWPTHGPAITAPRPHVNALIAHREKRENAILAALNSGLAQIPKIVSRLYRGVPRHLHPAAERTVLSHLIHLVETGHVVCDGPPTIDGEYTIKGPKP